jgi:P27 family predicted phage terminase small subunit
MKTNKQKQIAGTIRTSDAQNTGEPIKYVPEPENTFNDFARQVYFIVCEDLQSRSLLFKADLHHVEGFSNDTAIYRECMQDIVENGIFYVDKNKQKRRNPALIAMRSAMESANKTAKLLGITPYYRDKIKMQSEVEKEIDPVADLLLGRN